MLVAKQKIPRAYCKTSNFDWLPKVYEMDMGVGGRDACRKVVKA
jgi:hypothetical protein